MEYCLPFILEEGVLRLVLAIVCAERIEKREISPRIALAAMEAHESEFSIREKIVVNPD